MTAKDLNLDPALLQSWPRDTQSRTNTPARKQAQTRRPAQKPTSTPATGSTPLPEPIASRQPTKPGDTRRLPAATASIGIPPTAQPAAAPSLPDNSTTKGYQTLLIGIIAVANMLFLMLAGIWLTGVFTPTHPGPETLSADSAREVQVQAMLTDLDHRMAAMEQNLATLHAIQADLLELLKNPIYPENQIVSDPAEQAVPTAETTPPSTSPWQVNLAEFRNRGDALTVQQQVHALGFQASINQHSNNGESSYRVTLAGFQDRESAEMAAGQIMDKTGLNGLWVNKTQ